MERRRNLRRVLLLIPPAAAAASLLSAQEPPGVEPPVATRPDDIRLPNGKKQRDAILKADYEQNVKDAQTLVAHVKDFQRDLEKSDEYVLSLGLLKQLDDIEKITKRIRGRMRRF
jgi:hypothetical protein